MAPFNLGLRNSRFDIDVPELFEGGSNQRNVRSANSVAGQLPRKCMDKDGWVQSHPRSCKLKNTAPSLLSR